MRARQPERPLGRCLRRRVAPATTFAPQTGSAAGLERAPGQASAPSSATLAGANRYAVSCGRVQDGGEGRDPGEAHRPSSWRMLRARREGASGLIAPGRFGARPRRVLTGPAHGDRHRSFIEGPARRPRGGAPRASASLERPAASFTRPRHGPTSPWLSSADVARNVRGSSRRHAFRARATRLGRRRTRGYVAAFHCPGWRAWRGTSRFEGGAERRRRALSVSDTMKSAPSRSEFAAAPRGVEVEVAHRPPGAPPGSADETS
jgi:hypothetical protein